LEKSDQTRELKDTSYELFILLLSLLSLFNLLIFVLPRVDPVVEGVVAIVDVFITVIFMLDFLNRFFSAESKTQYFFREWGWADLLASLPIQQLKIFRTFRVVRVIRLMRTYGLRNMLKEIRDNRAGSALYLTIFTVILVLEFGGMGIVFAEKNTVGANIKTAGDGVWWSLVTITTVGYGDHFPVTQLGRWMGFLVMVIGVGTFGVLTGFLANAFLSPPAEEPPDTAQKSGDADEILEIMRLLDDQAKVNEALLGKLERIEESMAWER